MRYYIPLLSCCTLTILAPVPVSARVVGGFDLSALCDQADVVVVARAGEPRKLGATTLPGTNFPSDAMVAQLTVDKVLKGQPRGNSIALSFVLPTTPLSDGPRAPVTTGQYAVFFLRAIEDGYQVVNPDYPSVVALPGSPQISGSVLSQTTAELCYALESPTSTLEDKQEALRALDGVWSAMATEALIRATHNDPVANLRVAELALLLRRNDMSELASAESLMMHPPSDVDPEAMDSLAFAIRFWVHDPQAIPSLARLLLADNVKVRLGAAAALRHTKDKAAIKPLILALNDTDPDVLYQAVLGLAELNHTRGEWGPGEERFLKDPEHYVDHWRVWGKSQN